MPPEKYATLDGWMIKCGQHFRRAQPPEGAITGPSLLLISPPQRFDKMRPAF